MEITHHITIPVMIRYVQSSNTSDAGFSMHPVNLELTHSHTISCPIFHLKAHSWHSDYVKSYGIEWSLFMSPCIIILLMILLFNNPTESIATEGGTIKSINTNRCCYIQTRWTVLQDKSLARMALWQVSRPPSPRKVRTPWNPRSENLCVKLRLETESTLKQG